ncbi:hypothetical protein DC522_05945 [Microvirga sp. KLBC 81]|uniref:hypothetical protein n=1 Tax=Microvirga sp. KLBC 81 TaxID=1862707 RepID=UPI000D51B070|nr:hypothetical protein [Microvirga sp. KLBC 81]PVE25435.1 hypothetical protein DC522_05945 [Microvirga sp. KLBC 81]
MMDILEPAAGPGARLPLGIDAPQARDPGIGDTLGAAFRQSSTVGSAIAALHEPFQPEEGYNPLADIKDTRYEFDYGERFAASRSRAETEWLKSKIDQEIQDANTVAASGVAGIVASIGMGLVDPTIVLPGGAIYRGARGGYAIGRTALSAAAAGAVQGLASEAILQGTQETRTTGDLLASVATSTVLSGLLGAGAAALLSRAERRALEVALDRDRVSLGDAPEPGLAASVGAAASDTRIARPQSYLLDKVPGLGDMVERVSPVLRTMQSDLSSARRAVVDLAETALATVDNKLGIPTTRGPSAEREIRLAQRQTAVQLDDLMDDAWKRYRFGSVDAAPTGARLRDAFGEVAGRTGEKLSFSQFDDEVGKAMRRGDQHEIPEVAEVAKWVRANVFEPWKERAIKLGMLPEGVDVKTAESYFTRSYNRDKITSRMSDFVKRSADWLEQEQTRKFELQGRIEALDEERRSIQAEAKKLEAKLERAQERIQNLDATVKERGMEVNRTADRVDTLEERLGNQEQELSELAEAVSAFRSQIQDPELRAQIEGLQREVSALQREERQSRMSPAALDRAEEAELKQRFLATDEDKTLADMVIGRRKAPKEPNFAAYIVKEGGVLDTGGDLRAAIGGNNAFPGLLNRQGLSLDEWGEKLWNRFPGWFTERPSPDEVLRFIEDALRGNQPHWFVESKLAPDDLRLIEMQSVADDTKAEMVRLGYPAEDRLDVARFLADHTESVPAGPERFDQPGMPPLPASVLLEGAEGALAREKDVVAQTRDAITAARGRTAQVENAAGRNRTRLSEAGSAADRNVKRAATLEERRAIAEKKQSLLNDALAIARDNEAAVFARIEKELEGWGGNSAKEALSAIKSRNRAMEGRDPNLPRLTSADGDVLNAVRRIHGSDRQMSRMELEARAREIADRIVSSPDGRLPYGDASTGGGGVPAGRDAPRGALAQREFMIPDEIIEDFLDDSVSHAARKFLHTTVPDIVLSERFGDFNLTEVIRKINDEAQALAQGADEKRSAEIFAKRDAAIQDIAAMRDRIRGTFALGSGGAAARNAGRVGAAVRAYNMMTDLGGAAISSIPDIAGSVFRWGFTTVLGDAYRPFVKGLLGASDGWKQAKSQYRAMGIATEMALATRSRAINDISAVYRPESRLERVLQAGAEASQVLNLQAPWTDFTKTVAAITSGNEIFRATKALAEGKASAKQIENLAASGIDEHMAQRIWKSFVDGGEIVDGVYLPNTADWKDRAARLAFEGAVSREADIVVVTPGQEKPLWLSKPIIGLIGQHKSFIFAATERLMLANLQRRDAATLSGLITGLSAGMMAAALYSVVSGKPLPERPQDWIKEGLSRSGILGWFDEANAISAKATRGGVDIYRLIGADRPLSRFSSQTVLSQLMGPSAGKIETITKATGAAFGEEDWSGRDTANARRLIPFQNLFYLRRLLNQVEDAGNELFGVEPLSRR